MSRLLVLLLSLILFISCRYEGPPVNEAREISQVYQKAEKAMAAYLRSQGDSALYLFDSVYSGPGRFDPLIVIRRYDLLYVIAENIRHDHHQAGLYADSAMEYIKANHLTKKYPRQYFTLLCNKGELESLMGNYDESYQYYLAAKQWAFRYLTHCEAAAFSYNMGMVLYRQRKYTESSNYFKEALGLYAGCQPPEMIINRKQELLDNIGLCFVKAKQYDSALYYFNQALVFLEQNKDSVEPRLVQMARGVLLGNAAKVYVATNRLDTAASLFRESISINSQYRHDAWDAQLVQAQLAEVYEKQNRYPEMLATLGELKKGLDTAYSQPADLAWKRLMAVYYRYAGKPADQLRYYEAYIHLRDSINAVENNGLQTDIGRQIKAKEQELEITLLKKNNQLNRIYLIVAIILSVIAVLVILFVYYNFRKTARLNRLISSQKEELEQLNQVKNKMFSVVSHDMRSPVNSLSAFIQLLEKGRVSQDSLIGYSQALKKKLADTTMMMENLLNWAASQLEGFRAFIERAPIRPVTEKAVTGIAGQAAEKQVSIDNEISPGAMAAIDKDMLEVVMRNLLGNAVKYSYPGAVVTLSAAISGDGQSIRIQVKDEGAGMTADYVERINSGSLLLLRSTAGTAREKGTGLGIYLSLAFIKMMYGSLQVESDPGRGTRFTITLPA